jgi:ankyrin repeat protein
VEVQIEIIQSHRHISSNNKKSSARWQIDRPVKNMRITPLHWAAYNGHVEGIQELVKRGADVGLKDRRGRCALDWACTNGHLEAAQVLLDSGADPNIRDREGYSPLHKAVMGGYLEAAKLLLDWGANVDAQPPSWKERRKSHNTSSQYVASSDSLGATTTSPAPEHEAGDLSLAATEPSDNNTPASTNSTDVPHDANSIVEREDSDSTAGLSDDVALTPLHIALRATDSLMFPMINTLVSKYGADVNISDMLSRSPLHYAANAGNLPLLELFLQQGAYVDSQDEDGWTALHRATLRGHTQCVKLLVDYGADPAIKTNFGQTCLHMAVQNSNLSCVEAILAPQLLSGSHESVGGSAYLGGDGSTRLSPRQVIGDEVQHRESFDTGNVITSITEPEPAPIQTPTSPNNARRASVKIGVPQRPPDTQNVDLSNRHSRIKPKSIDPALLALLLPPGARVTSPPGSPRSNSAQLGQPNITQPSSKRRPLLKRSKSSLDVKHASQLRRSEGVLFHEDPEIIERRANSVRQLNESPPLRDRESRSMSPPSNRVRPRSNSTASSDKGSEVFTGRRHYLRTKGGDDKHSSVTTSSLLSTSPGDNIGSLSISPPHTSFVQPSGNGRQSPVPSFLTTSSRQPEQPEIASPASSPANTNAPPNTLVIPSSTPIAIVAPASESLPANEEGRRKSIRGASRGLRVTTDNAVVSSSSTLYSPPLSPPSMQRHSTADLDATLQWQVEPTPPQRQLAASSSPSCSPRTIRRTRSSSVADMRNRVNSFRGSKSNKRLSAHAESTAAVSPSSQKSISSGVDILTSEPVPFISSSTKKRRARSRSSHASSSPLGKTIKRVASALVPPTGRKHINIIELLNEPDSTGAGPLHTAVRCANLPLVKMLVQHGAQVNTKASNNTTPLDCAIQRSDIYTTIFLLENGAFISEAALQLLQFVSSRGGTTTDDSTYDLIRKLINLSIQFLKCD